MIDAEVVEEEDVAALVPTNGSTLAVTPEVEAGDLVKRLDVIKSAAQTAMKLDVDYGKVPNTNKDCLFKPGAEKLSVLFQLDVQIENEKVWGPDDHLTVMSKATAYHAPSGTRLGFGEGLCSTREKKYAKRNAQPKCPNCEKDNIRRSKDGDGFYCWRKTDGCGMNFPANDERITSQPEGQIDNPDLPDTWNTVVKMAEKRARVDVVLAVTGASALFTQDIEDQVVREPSPEPRPFDMQRLAWASKAVNLSAEQKAAIGAWVGFDGQNEQDVDQERVKRAIERIEAGDVDGLMKLTETNGVAGIS